VLNIGLIVKTSVLLFLHFVNLLNLCQYFRSSRRKWQRFRFIFFDSVVTTCKYGFRNAHFHLTIIKAQFSKVPERFIALQLETGIIWCGSNSRKGVTVKFSLATDITRSSAVVEWLCDADCIGLSFEVIRHKLATMLSICAVCAKKWIVYGFTSCKRYRSEMSKFKKGHNDFDHASFRVIYRL